MNFDLDIEKAVSLVNKKSTTVDDVCKLLFEAVTNFQDSRENYHLQELKERHQRDSIKLSSDSAEQIADEISAKVEKEVKRFVPTYVDKSIDGVLDAMNEKKFRTKKGPKSLLLLLATLKETYQSST